MPTTVPAGYVNDGFVRVWFVPTIANPAAPTATEINAGTTLDVTCYLTNGFNPDVSVATITDDRLCLAVVLEDMGSATWSIDELNYVWDPQTPAGTNNKAYATLTQGTSGYLVVRYGMNVDQAVAAAQRVHVFPVKLGPRVPLPVTRNSKGAVKQKPFVTGPVQESVAVA